MQPNFFVVGKLATALGILLDDIYAAVNIETIDNIPDVWYDVVVEGAFSFFNSVRRA